MIRDKTPQNDDFILSNKIYRAEMIAYIILIPLVIIQLFYPSKPLLIITTLTMVAMFIFNKIRDYFFDRANDSRIVFLLDKSFNESLNPYPNNDYYDNDDIQPSLIKLLANTHESSFFTYNISKKMNKMYFGVIIIVLLIIIISIFSTGINNFSSTIISLVLSGSLINRGLALGMLAHTAKLLYNQCNDLCNDFNSISNSNFGTRKVLDIIIRYESLLRDTKIVLSNNIYENEKEHLTRQWTEIKNEFNIYKQVYRY